MKFSRRKKKLIALAIVLSVQMQSASTLFAAAQQIDIATPNVQGLSHNKMEQFNVGKEGVVFNNNAGVNAVQSVLGGQIARNSHLTLNNPATTILTEVTGGSVSKLNGMMEIAGQKANLIIANPNGIVGNGFGFINVDRATLTTGKPMIDDAGNLKGFSVAQGKVQIVGNGNKPELNEDGSYKYAPVNKLDIYAHAAEINAELWAADELNIVVGKNTIDYNDKQNVKALTNTETGVNLDVGAVGGMYAGAITLVGTNAGLGMKIGGNLQAQKDLQITNDGKIVFEKNITTSVEDGERYDEVNTVSAAGDISIDAGKYTIDNAADIAAGGMLTVTTKGHFKNSGKLIAGEEDEESGVRKAGDLTVKAADGIESTGVLDASNNIVIRADGGAVALSGSTAASNDVEIDAKGVVDVKGSIVAEKGSVKLAGEKVNYNEQNIKVTDEGKLSISETKPAEPAPQPELEPAREAEKLDNPSLANVAGVAATVKQEKTADDTLKLVADANVDGRYKPIIDKAANGVDMVQIAAVNGNGVSRNVYSDFNIKSSGLILNNATKYAKTELGGYIDKNMKLVRNGARVILNEVSSSNPSVLNGYLEVAGNKASVVIANANGISINGLGFINTDDVTLSTGRVMNWTDGNFKFSTGEGDFTIAGDGLNGLTQKQMQISARNFTNDRSELYANELRLDANGKLQNTGKIGAIQNLTMHAASLENAQQGYIEAENNLDLTVDGALAQDAATIKAGKNTKVIAGDFANRNTALISAGENLNLTSAKDVANSNATMLAGQKMQLTTQNVKNTDKGIINGSVLQLDSDKNIVNDNANIYFSNNGSIKADSIENSSQGSIYFGGDAEIESSSLANTKADINIMGNLIAKTGTFVNTDSAYLAVGKNAELTGDTFTNSALGSVFVDNNLTITSVGDVLNEDALVATGGNIVIRAQNFKNRNDARYVHGAVINAGGNIDITARNQFVNQSSDIGSAQNITIAAQDIHNKKDKFATDWVVTTEHIAYAIPHMDKPRYYKADREFTRTIHTGVIKEETNDANIIASGNITLHAADNIENSYSKIMAGKDLTVDAGNKVENVGYQGTIHHDDAGQDNHHWKYKKKKRWWKRSKWVYGTTVLPYKDHKVYDQQGDGSERLSVFSANGKVAIHAKEEVNKTLEADGNAYNDRSKTVKTDVADKLQGKGASDKLALDNSKLFAIDALRGNSRIYTLNDDPSAKYLIETNKKFADYREFLSSDYLLARVKADPEKVAKRIGDGYFEQQLVMQQIMQLTGRKYLDTYGSDMEQFAALMNAGAVAAQQMNLSIGVALTAEQVASLTSDMIWLVEKEVKGQKVLVPEVYLASLKEGDLRPNGALIVGSEVELYAKDNLENIGTIKAAETVALQAGNIANRFGSIAGENVKATAENDIVNAGGSIAAEKDIELQAKNITNEAVRENSDYKELKQQRIVGTGFISAGHDLKLNAAENIANIGGVLAADNTLRLEAGKNIDITTVANEKHVAVVSRGSTAEIHSVQNQQAVLSGRNIAMNAGADISSTGGVFSARENTEINAAGDVNLRAAKDLYSEEASIGSRGSDFFARGRNVDEAIVGTEIASGKNIGITAQNINIKGSNASSENGAVNLDAAQNVEITNENEYHESLRELHQKSRGMLRSKTTDIYDYSNVDAVVGSNVSGSSVNITTGNDVKVQGSSVAADGDVNVKAGGELDIASGTQTSENVYIKQVKKSGLLAGPGLGFTIGKEKKRDEYDNQNVEQVGSTVGSVNGNVTLQAEKDANIKGSDVIAGKNISITGANVNIENSDSIYNAQEKHEYERSGLSVSVGGTIANTAETVYNSLERAHQVEDKRLAALYGVKGYMDVKEGISKIEDTFANSKGKFKVKPDDAAKAKKEAKNSLVNIRVGIGSEKSRSESDSTTIAATASNVKAVGDVNITSTKEDINIKGSNVEGENVQLTAAKELNITASKDSNVTKQDSKSSSASVGMAGFAGVDARYSQGKSNVRANSEQYNESAITANNELTFTSGADTNIKGGVLSGEQVKGNIGDDLNIESLQDQNDYKEKSSSVGASVSYGASGWGGSANASKSRINSEYESVTTQSGINAGKKGFDIRVENNTDLKGGIIGSEADADKNKLSTGTLTFSDIENKAEYSAGSVGVNANFYKGAKNNEKGVTPNIGMPASGNTDSTTKATVAAGEIEIRDKDNQKQNIAELNRDLNNSLNKLGEIFDKTKVQERQELAGLFGELAYNEIHRLSEREKRKINKEINKLEADEDHDHTLEITELEKKRKLWEESGANKVALHAVVGGIMSSIATGDFTTGAYSTAINESFIKQIKDIAGENPDVMQWISTVIGGVVAKATGEDGMVGASTAASATKNNEVLTAEEIVDILFANGRDKAYFSNLTKENISIIKKQLVEYIDNNQNTDALMINLGIGNSDNSLMYDVQSKTLFATTGGNIGKGIMPIDVSIVAITFIVHDKNLDINDFQTRKEILSGASLSGSFFVGPGGSVSVPIFSDYTGRVSIIAKGIGTPQLSGGVGVTAEAGENTYYKNIEKEALDNLYGSD